ncbi:hypothetical protein N9M61_01260 [Gammaproteobacteria bacterium]|nr:hypothetical protein [Gammaproteobacteria bacterium]MDC0919633.1 hypothetical protein [Gammaproteobacteria bacterium]
MIKKNTFLYVLIISFLASCASTSNIGPQYQSNSSNSAKSVPENIEPFDVAISLFDPGISNQDSYGDDGVWPELRRSEAMYMAVQLRDVLAKTQRYGAVRVTPDNYSSADVYITAKIIKSNGEDVALQVKVSDSTGKTWVSKKYSHRVKPIAFNNPRNKDSNGKLKIDPYKDIYLKISSDIIKYMKRNIKPEKADTINTVTEIRYAQNYSPAAFSDILSKRNNLYKLNGKPDKDDPMMKRVQSIKYRDQMFIDNMQTHYDGFSSNMTSSYKVWQEQSFAESKAAREAASAAFWQGVAGAVIVAATVAAAGDCDSAACARNTGAVGGAVAGAFFNESFQNSKEAKVHRDALNEIASSLDSTLSPSVIEMEDRTVTLTGTITEQSNQWRAVLLEIFQAETQVTKPLL